MTDAANSTSPSGAPSEVLDLYPDNSALAMDYAKGLLRSGQAAACLKVLDRTTILPYEGAQEGHDLYRQACLFQAVEALKKGNPKNAVALVEKARLWPEHLGVGRPYDTDERLEDFLAALCRKKQGNPAESGKFLEEAVSRGTREFRAELRVRSCGQRSGSQEPGPASRSGTTFR